MILFMSTSTSDKFQILFSSDVSFFLFVCKMTSVQDLKTAVVEICAGVDVCNIDFEKIEKTVNLAFCNIGAFVTLLYLYIYIKKVSSEILVSIDNHLSCNNLKCIFFSDLAVVRGFLGRLQRCFTSRRR